MAVEASLSFVAAVLVGRPHGACLRTTPAGRREAASSKGRDRAVGRPTDGEAKNSAPEVALSRSRPRPAPTPPSEQSRE